MIEARRQVAGLIEGACGLKVGLEEIRDSPAADLASTVAFKLASERKENPAGIAKKIAGKIRPRGLVKNVDASGGYLNFHLDYEEFTKHVLSEVLAGGYGRGALKKEKIVLEHTSINPSGPIHVGRLRNTLIGDSLRRILEYAGYDVETHYYVNDIGKQIAMIALGLEEDTPTDKTLEREYERYKKKEDFQVFFKYVAANKRFEEDDEFKNRVQELIRHAEEGNVSSLEKITNAAEICLDGQKETFNRLGVKFDAYDYESTFLTDGSVKKVLNQLKKNPRWQTSDAGSGLDLTEFGIERKTGFTVLERPDGTSVYSSRDIAYHQKKALHGDRLINVLGEDHKMQFQELKTILEKMMGFKKKLEVVHFSFVNFEGQELSTRKGQTAPVDMLLDEAEERAEKEVKTRGIGDETTVPMIGVGAVKYHIIKTDPNKPITFRWEDALSFDGDAAPYIQYAHARSCRIVEKSGVEVSQIRLDDISFALTEEEKSLIKLVAAFPERVEKSAADLKPNYIATYLYELAASYSRFYKNCQVLDVDEKTMKRRLLLVHAVQEIIREGLNLIGVEAPQRM